MNIKEYNKIKDLTYREYCGYLQNKYGQAVCDYMTKSFNKNPKVTRTSEGLFAHHKYEDHAILLAQKDYAMRNPFEWQQKENIIYCDYLEHLLLHILICEYPSPEANLNETVGIGGAINFLIPELNDLFSGIPISQGWKQTCFDKVKEDLDCYVVLVNRLIDFIKSKQLDVLVCVGLDNCIRSSYNQKFGKWSEIKNRKITQLFNDVLR